MPQALLVSLFFYVYKHVLGTQHIVPVSFFNLINPPKIPDMVAIIISICKFENQGSLMFSSYFMTEQKGGRTEISIL